MAELLYIEKEKERLLSIKDGIGKNAAAWTGTSITALTVQADIDALTLAKKNVIDTEILLHQLRTQARTASVIGASQADALELKVKGIHSGDTSKWAEYGIDAHENIVNAKPAKPAKGMIKSIIDDSDGIGFIVKGEPLSDIDVYEWERGVGTVTDPKIIPAFVHIATNKKASLLDDEVNAGVRYFYRYRGFNTSGYGEWSEPTSKIQ